MRIESLGHESWMITSAQGITLVDPLLNKEFGNSEKYVFKKLSHRKIRPEELNRVTSAILTTEYFQHFDKKSIEALPKSAVIFISPTFSVDDASWIQSLKLKIVRPKYGQTFDVDGLECVFIPSSPSTVKWDIRVSSLAVGCVLEESLKWLFFQSDTAASPDVSKYIPKHWPRKPDLVTVTSHWKEHETPGFSSWDNLISPPATIADPRAAMFLVGSILPLKIFPLNIARRYAVCGGDYFKGERPLPKPISDNSNLAEMAQALALNANIFRARAGTVIDLVSDTIAQSPFESSAAPEKPIEPFSVVEPHCEWDDIVDRQDLDKAMAKFGTALLLSELGRHLLFCDEYLGRQLGSRRFALTLVHASGHDAYEFCFAAGEFVRCSTTIDEQIDLPAGLIVARSALVDIQRQNCSAAEACSFNAVHWTTGPANTAPLGLLYSTFGFGAVYQ